MIKKEMKIGDSVFIYLETKPHEDKWNNYFMDVAIRTSEMSKGKRLKVGAVAVKDKRIVCTGYNGTVSKYGDESLEDENGNTKIDVLHAEENLVAQAALHGVSLRGAIIYCNYNPCRHCAALLAQVGVSEVVYLNEYRDLSGIEKLKQYRIKVTKL